MDIMEQTLPLADIIDESVVDGLGIRFVVFVQGCPHNCPGCQNPTTHAMSGGVEKSLGWISALIDKDPLLSGVTYSGGEPFLYPKQLAALADYVHGKGMNIWCYTGYTYEELLALKGKKELLDRVDILVDGRFVEELKDPLLKFRGSSNQRLIDLKKMRETGAKKVILLDI